MHLIRRKEKLNVFGQNIKWGRHDLEWNVKVTEQLGKGIVLGQNDVVVIDNCIILRLGFVAHPLVIAAEVTTDGPKTVLRYAFYDNAAQIRKNAFLWGILPMCAFGILPSATNIGGHWYQWWPMTTEPLKSRYRSVPMVADVHQWPAVTIRDQWSLRLPKHYRNVSMFTR